MEDEILNKVAQSALVVFDLEDYYPAGRRELIDLSQWLFEGYILKEKAFRTALAQHNWSNYQDAFVAITCSTDAIIPKWASMLVAVQLQPFSKKIVLGNLETLETSIYQDILNELDYTQYQDKPMILKGCSKKPVPEGAYILALQNLQTVAKSIMFGEACSAVPMYKRK
ncbi:hypothetical protein B0A58_01990 [Flavobacterium branchiophilum NBRC 15030 = ATCC 35035]|uniref:DUF2480 family protein n=2 Tax=Flavobacterium branchiophilum TaxID=55197 RepID=G2Z6G4_FLABF|nr:DUF2480 family protein [Flavobacterium branchiophilum]OXA80864.1 hypothetical protein B0A58_01990 [Flavobacterium branchiophilum NBRC 15030 = ATCC 35035]PDS24234.1 DUF2480 domain-containing protein [Flavobacterium branchiophilum]TQM40397.1 uncharacterized protein DUF2480 [Flavobacterium branchiophilum]CCB70990.1 Protein of unknown function [Flavobacterium branchiophilum FL-15]GEM54478.1 hypothetical protein FB1_06990 [Flavobacterium branchiophilum NBRC 15030 = ATCC 35035]